MNKNKILNDIINGRTEYSNIQYNSPKLIGSISKIFSENRFENFEQYEKFYIKNVHSYEYLAKLSQRISDEVGFNFDVSAEEVYNYLIDLIFQKSWDGFMGRIVRAISFLSNNDFCNIVVSPAKIDSDYAIDLFANRENKKYAIQVKPITFLDEHYNYHYIQNLKKNLKFLNILNEDYFILYLFEDENKFKHILFNKIELEEKISAIS